MLKSSKRSGAALIESCLVVSMLCLILFGILQVSYLIAASDVISYTCLAAARSAQVGFNSSMIDRVARVVSIPTAGPIITPAPGEASMVDQGSIGKNWDMALFRSPESSQFMDEYYLIPFYLGAENDSELNGILNYDNWSDSDTRIAVTDPGDASSSFLNVTVSQKVPMVMPFARAFSRFFSSKETVNVYRSSNKRGLAQNGWFDADAGYFEVPFIEMKRNIGLENHSAYYMEKE